MSWHAGDWANFSVSIFSAISAAWSAYAAKKSNDATKENLALQRKTEEARDKEAKRNFILNTKLKLLDQLTYDARRANSFDTEREVDPWSPNSSVNIIYSIDSAKHKIKSWIKIHGDEDEKFFIEYFLDQLNYRIVKHLRAKFMPRNLPNDREIFLIWYDNKIFFVNY